MLMMLLLLLMLRLLSRSWGAERRHNRLHPWRADASSTAAASPDGVDEAFRAEVALHLLLQRLLPQLRRRCFRGEFRLSFLQHLALDPVSTRSTLAPSRGRVIR